MSFLAFGAGFVNALNNRKREERAEEAVIRREDRAFEIAKKKFVFENLYNQQNTLQRELRDLIVKVQTGQIKDEDGVPLTIDSPSVKKSIQFIQDNITEVNNIINGTTPSNIVTAEQGTDINQKKPSVNISDESSFDITMGITPATVEEQKRKEFEKQVETLPGGKLTLGIGKFLKGAAETLTDKEKFKQSGLAPKDPDAIPRLGTKN